jgi:hypothetical protein
VGLYIHSPICLHGVVFDYLSTGTTVPFTVQLRTGPVVMNGELGRIHKNRLWPTSISWNENDELSSFRMVSLPVEVRIDDLANITKGR